MPDRIAVCTIVSRNYLHFARVLMSSLKVAHPTWKRTVLLVDDDTGIEDHPEEFTLLRLRDLVCPVLQEMLFHYTILEMNTAAKPWLLSQLIAEGADAAIYFDPDIRVYRRLRELEAVMDGEWTCVLTPHLSGELDDDRQPSELDIMSSGCYNLGFIAVSQAPKLLDWWQRKSIKHFPSDPARGLFTDQKWMDLVPSLFSGVKILRSPAYNVAYWNLLHRPMDGEESTPKVCGQPLGFFHFSGLNPENPAPFSKHQNRFTLATLPPVTQALVKAYVRDLMSHGACSFRTIPYFFNNFSDGTPVHWAMRRARLWSGIPDLGPRPFDADPDLFNDLAPGAHGPVTILLYHIWKGRSDLHQVFSDPLGRDGTALADWFLHSGAKEEGLGERFQLPVRRLQAAQKQAEGDHYYGVSAGLAQAARRKLRPLKWLLPSRVRRWGNALVTWTEEAPSPVPVIETTTANKWAIGGSKSWLTGFHEQGPWEHAHGMAWIDAEVVIQLPPGMIIGALRVRGQAMAAIGAQGVDSRTLSLVRDDGPEQVVELPWEGPFSVVFPVMEDGPAKNRLFLRVQPCAIPAEIGQGEDPRRLGVLIASINADGSTLMDFSLDDPILFSHQVQVPKVAFLGYLKSEMGVGEACRGVVRALRTTDADLSTIDLSKSAVYRAEDDSLGVLEDGIVEEGSGVAIVHTNADQTPAVCQQHKKELAGKHVIGIWYWELSRLPRRWFAAFTHVHELWAPTRFIQDALSVDAPVPVVLMPPAITTPQDVREDRKGFGIPESKFTVLCMYDMRSFQHRKNPEAAVQAYCQAFPKENEAFLVVKVMNGDNDASALATLRTLTESRQDIMVLDKILPR